jgi:hypothetical protein
MIVLVIQRIQLIGRLTAGWGRSGRLRLSHPWTCSAI